MNEKDLVLFGIVVLICMIVLFVAIIRFVNRFTAELRYLNDEIQRTEGSERRYWIKRKKRLWLSLIPFVKY